MKSASSAAVAEPKEKVVAPVHAMDAQIDDLTDYIMKNCLWQFHSRSWDRLRQNEEILKKTKQILCGEPVDLSTNHDRCYWVDAVCMAEDFRADYAWMADLDKEQIASLMDGLYQRINYLTVGGSLNEELTDKNY
uniref:Nitrogenase iron-iron protein delta chain n=2 Tax=Unclassified Bacteria TaxID=49928 RepID=Q9WW26_UNCXX|nr:nitrogenase 3 delta subunit [nitrogen-fixing bacterium SM2]AAD40092.1 nitrogenase 3 delta subunit [nitrogen-fixing bacterium SM1]